MKRQNAMIGKKLETNQFMRGAKGDWAGEWEAER